MDVQEFYHSLFVLIICFDKISVDIADLDFIPHKNLRGGSFVILLYKIYSFLDRPSTKWCTMKRKHADKLYLSRDCSPESVDEIGHFSGMTVDQRLSYA
jgi:hypothetical protein